MIRRPGLVLLTVALASGACTLDPPGVGALYSVRGLESPEAVRFDPDQDVWFVSNFNGAQSGDSNGFISRVAADGKVEHLRFMVGTLAPLHAPRGLFITGDTLWAADADGVHGFDRKSGVHIAFVDFRPFDPGFLNDIAQGPDGALYVTDTGDRHPRVFRFAGGDVSVAIEDSTLGPPNGITWDPDHGRFFLAGWGSGGAVRTWRPGSAQLQTFGLAHTGRFDGIEIVGAAILVASQADSSIHEISGGIERVLIRVAGKPGDIGVDLGRRRIAVPYLDLNRVDVWELPAFP